MIVSSYVYSVNADASNEQLILNQLLNVLVKALKMKSETHRDSESALEPH